LGRVWLRDDEDRLGEKEVVLLMMVMMMSGMAVRVNVNVNRIRLREEVMYGLGAVCEL